MTHVIYVAGPWARRPEARIVRDQLVAAGHIVTSRWLDVDESIVTPSEEAQNDVFDILTADILVVLNLEKSEGKAFEQGVAYMAEIPIIAVGPQLNVFQTLPSYTFVDDVPALLDLLSRFIPL